MHHHRTGRKSGHAAGAVIGGIAGGGEGALIGAGVGALGGLLVRNLRNDYCEYRDRNSTSTLPGASDDFGPDSIPAQRLQRRHVRRATQRGPGSAESVPVTERR
jgi:hypothetical protein